MVKVKIVLHNSLIETMMIKGHAMAGSEGTDLVCAGCSSVVCGLANACDEMCEDDIRILLDENEAQFIVVKSNSTVQNVLNVGIIQLKTIAENFPKNVSIEITED